MTEHAERELPGHCDVIVFGGGPAGTLAACELAKAGLDVVLIDKARHPRNVVGESLIPHFWRYLDAIDATADVEAAGFISKGGGMGYWNGSLRRLRFADFGFERMSLHVERDEFDHILLKRAARWGAKVFQGVAATEVLDIEGPRCRIRYRHEASGETGELSASYVVDASGQSAVVSRQLGLRVFDDALRFSSFWGYYRGGSFLDFNAQIHPFSERRQAPPVTIQSTIGDWGWIWHIVQKEATSVGIILPHARLGEMKGRDLAEREARLQALVASAPLVGPLLKDAEYIPGSMLSIRDYAYKPTRLAIGRVYLAGDAAAFVDPINSAGVVFSMFSGTLAARSIVESLAKPARAETLRKYFELQYRARLSLFRMLAIPHATEILSPDEIQSARQAVAWSSTDEQRLMLLQATVSNRSESVRDALRALGLPDLPVANLVTIPDELRPVAS